MPLSLGSFCVFISPPSEVCGVEAGIQTGAERPDKREENLVKFAARL